MPDVPALPCLGPSLSRRDFADALARVTAAIRRDRRPLPSHELAHQGLTGADRRRWARAVLEAEDRHAVADFWRAAHALGAGSMFDHYRPRQEALPYFLRHERLAGVALAWSIHLDLHDGTLRGGTLRGGTFHGGTWARPRQWLRRWAGERWTIKQKFAAAMAAYRDVRAAHEAETAIVVRSLTLSSINGKDLAMTPHPVDLHVGARLRQRRVRLGVSQSALGAKAAITFQQIQKYERGANRCSASMLWTLAQALQVEPGYFFEGYTSDGAPAEAA